MGMTGIESAGAYTPRFRIDAAEFDEAWGGNEAAGVSTKAVPKSDEDAVTMAVEAIEAALSESAYEPSEIGLLAVGTTTPPIDEGEIGATVAEIVGLGRDLELAVHTQSTRAGTEALCAAVRADTHPAIVVAADCPVGRPPEAADHAAGAGAVAFVLDADGPVTIDDHAAYTQEYAGTRFRRRGASAIESYDATGYERDAYRTVIAGAVDALGIDSETGDSIALAPSAPDGGLPYRAGRAVDVDVDVYEPASSLGDLGAASALFGLLEAWDDGREETVVVGYGDGASADALQITGSLDVDRDRTTESIDYASYARRRGFLSDAEGGD